MPKAAERLLSTYLGTDLKSVSKHPARNSCHTPSNHFFPHTIAGTDLKSVPIGFIPK
jgi:hypothetical protein